jgi:ABC-type sugar transport system permease subunit
VARLSYPPVARLWRHRWPLLFIAPFFVLFAVFFLYPVVFSL